MIAISKQWSFDAAHQLVNIAWSDQRNQEVFGKCSNLHGHTYTLEVSVTGDVAEDTGMVLNYFDLDAIVRPTVEALDHKSLNRVFPFLTTAENIVQRIGKIVEEDLADRYDTIHIYQVTLQETPKTKAIWRPNA